MYYNIIYFNTICAYCVGIENIFIYFLVVLTNLNGIIYYTCCTKIEYFHSASPHDIMMLLTNLHYKRLTRSCDFHRYFPRWYVIYDGVIISFSSHEGIGYTFSFRFYLFDSHIIYTNYTRIIHTHDPTFLIIPIWPINC